MLSEVAKMGTKDPRADAEKYLEKHNVRGLFKYLSTKVLFAKPEDPKAFLVQELKKIRECQQEQKPVRCPHLYMLMIVRVKSSRTRGGARGQQVRRG